MAGVGTKAGAWGGAFIMLGIGVASGTLFGWFDLAKAYWTFL